LGLNTRLPGGRATLLKLVRGLLLDGHLPGFKQVTEREMA
jgi:hypothetical protein